MNDEQLQQTLGGPVMFGKPRREGHRWGFWKAAEAHLWCARCTRTFPNGVVRFVERRPTCAYADCNGAFDTQIHPWSEVRSLNPRYPEHPTMSVQYGCPPWSEPYRHPGSVSAHVPPTGTVV